MFELTTLQNQGINEIEHWYHNGSSPFFYLAGYAGAGKSSVARAAVERCGLDPDSDKVKYACYAGKAAHVLQQKGLAATTIHQLIYIFEEDDKGKLRFSLNDMSALKWAKLLVLDECSMVNNQVAHDLLSFGVPILVLGDPGQLSPIEGNGYFTNDTPDFFLDEIHRQAEDDPIVIASQLARMGEELDFGDFGSFRKVRFDDITDDELRYADQILTGKNDSRRSMNQLLLDINGYNPEMLPYPAGVKLICTRNKWESGFINGMIGWTSRSVGYEAYNEGNRSMRQNIFIPDALVDSRTYAAKMNIGQFEDHWQPRTEHLKELDRGLLKQYEEDEMSATAWDFGYAVTVHKAIGSEWDNVIVHDDGMFKGWKPEDRKRWMYTAITRASKQLTIIV